MSCQDPTLRVIECAQALIYSQAAGAGTDVRIVNARLFEDLREAYADWIQAKREEIP